MTYTIIKRKDGETVAIYPETTSKKFLQRQIAWIKAKHGKITVNKATIW